MGPGRLGRHTAGQRHGPVLAVVVGDAQPGRPQPRSGIELDTVGQPELAEIEGGVIGVGTEEADEMVQHFGHTEGRQSRAFGTVEECLDFAGSRLVPEEGDDELGVENDHVLRRRGGGSSVGTSAGAPRAAYFPRSDEIGSGGIGRTTT